MLFQRILSQPVNRLLILVMVITALLPISLLAVHLNKTAWDNGWREIREKHQLLAENLTSPVQIYVEDHFASLSLLSETIKPVLKNPEQLTAVMNTTVDKLKGFASIAYVDAEGKMLAYKVADDVSMGNKSVSANLFTAERSFLFVRQTDEQYISGIKPSPFNLKPTIIMGMPVFTAQGSLMGVLLAELRVSLIEKIRQQIKFGQRGHSAIVDQNGRVIAHPNPEWMVEMKDLSSWPVVQAMMAGKQGVTEFYSSFIKQDMVAGYASVPGTGWGIMVPQPKSEVAAQVSQFMYSNYLWGGLGLIVAIIIGVLISGWITRPINRLAAASQKLLDNDLDGDIDYPMDYEPREAKQLGFAMKSLVRGLQHTKSEVAELNRNLQYRINDATKKLRVANSKLEETVRSDFLTSLANRRYFEMDLSDALSHREDNSGHLSILLFDIDNFKTINDNYGHAAGDEVLTHVARKLEQFMRKGDVAARYAGDEFVLRLCCDHRVAMSRANQIRQAIEDLRINWRNTCLQVTVSIGIYSEILSEDMDVRNVLHKVDVAMYEAKKRGRNCVKTFNSEMATVYQIM